MTLVAKTFGAFLGVTAVGAGIAVPLAQQYKEGVSSLSQVTIENFPEQYRDKDKCQLLAKDDSKEKYLLVCDFEENNSPRFFYFQVGNEKLSNVNSFKEPEKVGNEKIKFKFPLSENGLTNSGEGEITTSHHKWIDFLLETDFHNCKFANKPKNGSGWSIQCTQGVSKKQDINLAPIVFKTTITFNTFSD